MEIKEEFARVMANRHVEGRTVAEICELFHISNGSVYNYLKDPEIVSLIKTERAKKMILQLPVVDDCLFEACKKKDVKAIELFYERWDDYVRKSKNEINAFIDASETDELKKERLGKLHAFTKLMKEAQEKVAAKEQVPA